MMQGLGPKRVSSRRARDLKRIAFALIALTILLVAYKLLKPGTLALQVEISSERPLTAELFYDVGSGFSESQSQVREIHAAANPSSFEEVKFSLPRETIHRLRLDPSLTEGRYTFRRVAVIDSSSTLLNISPADLKPFNQIAERHQHGNQVTFVTTRGANDPGITLDLPRPLDGKALFGRATTRFVLACDAVFLCLAIFWFFARRQLEALWNVVRHLATRADSRLANVGRRLSNTNFIQFDSRSLWFYLLCLCLFLVAIAADLNGSSIGIFGWSYRLGPTETPLIGEPRGIRSDEWVSQTPTILNQVLREHPFQVDRSYLGNHRVILTANAPVRYFTSVFRPQFWSFFVLPIDYAFAVYWEFKILLLVAGIFTLLLLITKSSAWSIVGTLWYYFSPMTQWTFSWPSGLPEMVGLTCFTLVLACYLTIGERPVILFAAGVLCAGCAINLILCAYLPHLLPFVWFSVLLFASWCIAQRNVILRRYSVRPRLIAIAVSILISATTGFFLYKDLRVAMAGVAATIYPGSRHFSGGTLPLSDFASHFFEWTETELHIPPMLGNICEASGFLWLAPLTLFLGRRMLLSRLQRILLATLWIFCLGMGAWLLLPLPTWVGALFALDRTGVARPLPALGLANIAIVMLCISKLGRRVPEKKLATFGRAFKVLLAVFCGLCLTDESLANYFSWWELTLATLLTTALIVLLLEAKKKLFALVLIVPQALIFGAVNPVQQGLSVITAAPLYRFVHARKQLLRGKWFVYSDSLNLSGFLTAVGCDVYTGIRFLPDIDHFPLLGRAGLPVNAFNRDGLLLARPLAPNVHTSVEKLPIVWEVLWNVSPTDPVLNELHIQYFAFDHRPPDNVADQLQPLASKPISGVWLYERKERP